MNHRFIAPFALALSAGAQARDAETRRLVEETKPALTGRGAR